MHNMCINLKHVNWQLKKKQIVGTCKINRSLRLQPNFSLMEMWKKKSYNMKIKTF